MVPSIRTLRFDRSDVNECRSKRPVHSDGGLTRTPSVDNQYISSAKENPGS